MQIEGLTAKIIQVLDTKIQEKKERTVTQRERPPKGVYLRYLGMDLQF